MRLAEIDPDMFAEMKNAAEKLSLLLSTVGRCPSCDSDHVKLIAEFDEDIRSKVFYGECLQCRHIWDLDQDEIPPYSMFTDQK